MDEADEGLDRAAVGGAADVRLEPATPTRVPNMLSWRDMLHVVCMYVYVCAYSVGLIGRSLEE